MPREHDREVGVEPHDDREDERRAEHRDDVLGAEARRLAPGQALVRRDGLTRRGIDDIPLEHRHESTLSGVRQAPSPAQPSEAHDTPTTATDAEGTPHRLATVVGA